MKDMESNIKQREKFVDKLQKQSTKKKTSDSKRQTIKKTKLLT